MRWARAGRLRRPKRKRLLVGLSSVVVAVAILLGASVIVLTRHGDGLLAASHSLSVIGDPDMRVGEVFDFGVAIGNVSPDVSLVMRPATLPHGLPPHLQLLHQVLTYQGVLGDHGWPVGSLDGRHVITSPLDGARVAPGAQPIVVLAVVADRPGVYVVGPVTIHAEAPGPLGIGALPAEQTYMQYAVICIEQSRQACDAAQQQIIAPS
jgi:hypothetical protein